MIEIIPAIDVIDGHCVRLSQGDYGSRKIYDASPSDMAAAYADCGVKRIHLVDLDGAKASAPRNLSTLEKVASRVNVEIEWGGGVKTSAALSSVFDAGASHAIVGSMAAVDPELFGQWLTLFGTGKMILGADVKEGKIAVNGWLETVPMEIADLVNRLLPSGLEQVICTDISRDGMLCGPSFDLYANLRREFPSVCFTVSGGISSMDDIERLDRQGEKKVIVGKAIYENRISLEEIKQWYQNV